MKATGIVRRVDDLGRIVIPKEIRRTLRIREGDPSQTTLTGWEVFCFAMLDFCKRGPWRILKAWLHSFGSVPAFLCSHICQLTFLPLQ